MLSWNLPRVKNWHSASAHEQMTHIAVSVVQEGNNVIWMEKATDDHVKFIILKKFLSIQAILEGA